jgi:hypothetical protein
MNPQKVISQEATTVVFTAKSVERILKEGGTSSWRLDRNHARRCAYAVCTRNAYADWVEGPEPHHAAFLVGRVLDVVPAATSAENDKREKSRFLIRFSQFARVNIPDVWRGDRNPVSYRSLEEIGVYPEALKWEDMPEAENAAGPAEEIAAASASRALSLMEAKRGLALTFSVPPEAIEITIRG